MRNNPFSNIMRDKSNLQLESLIADDRYTVEARNAASSELKKRNLSTRKVNILEEGNVKEKVKNIEESKQEQLEKNEYKTNNSDTLELYSKKAILIFCFLFSTIFGTLLLYANLEKLKVKKGSDLLLAFGIFYTIICVVILYHIKTNYSSFISLITYTLNSIGAIILSELFWDKLIGKNFDYRSKKVWKPLLISISITLLLLAVYL